jgi:formylglycine-generating enzyme required for sulfatase activity
VRVTDDDQVFLSYSRNDPEAAASLRAQLEKGGLSVFKDDQSIREGDLWLHRLQQAVDACTGFVVLVGRDGVSRWIGAETQVALIRYFGPHDDAERLPIFPILLGDTAPESLPAFLRLFQVTPWNGSEPLPKRLLDHIRERTIVAREEAVFEGCPFVGLDAFKSNQARLFFGRQKETLDALACFDTRPSSPTVRWLEINGNSGSGKSSLMNAGLLPLVDQGWLWPRTGYTHWRRIGPMLPGEHPVGMLAESLVRFARDVLREPMEIASVRPLLQADDRGLADWLRGRKQEDTAFLLALDQFEELFTFADPDERRRFDRLLATALADSDCPLFLISTVRSDFLDRFGDLSRLVNLRNRLARPWTLPPIGEDGLREIIDGPARLAGLDVSEVREAIVAEARDEPGALPLAENALHWLWEQRQDSWFSGALLTAQGGLAGILSHSADALLDGLGEGRGPALELLFRLVKVDPEGRRHTRRRMRHAEAIAIAGGGRGGQALVARLAGERARDAGRTQGPLRLITVTEEEASADDTSEEADRGDGRWVNLIHETLIRSKAWNEKGKPLPYWPTLWSYVEANQDRAARRERLQLQAREWQSRKGPARLFGLAGWSGLFGFRDLAATGTIELRYLRWSLASVSVQALLLLAVAGLIGESLYWAKTHELPLEAIGTRWAHKLGKRLPFPKLVEAPAGQFRMGSESGEKYERPIHLVSIAQPFYLAVTEVTFSQYDTFCQATGRAQPQNQDAGWGRSNRPAINVDWDDARAYAGWLGAMTGANCRLPTEAEWEYAARAGTTTEYALPAPDGSDDIAGKDLANCNGCGSEWDDRQTAPVRSFKPNAWGLHDMHGNVWEWVEDCVNRPYDYEGASEDGRAWLEKNSGNCRFRRLRGGSWTEGQGDARSASRGWGDPARRINTFGFRVLCASPIVNH